MRVRMTPIRERVGKVGLKLENDIRDMNVLKTLCSASLLVVMASADARIPVKVETFPLSDVRLTQSPFKHAEDLDIRYLLGLDPDRLLAPYLKGAGLEPKADNYTNWENTGLDGHIGGALRFRHLPICTPPPGTRKSNNGWTTCCPNGKGRRTLPVTDTFVVRRTGARYGMPCLRGTYRLLLSD